MIGEFIFDIFAAGSFINLFTEPHYKIAFINLSEKNKIITIKQTDFTRKLTHGH